MKVSTNAQWHKVPVLLTGHTGFKGGWLTHWLGMLGAEVHGFSLPPPEDRPSFFASAAVEATLASHQVGDVADLHALKLLFGRVRPKVVFHLAAQPLVRASYGDPIGTYATNLMGTLHVLEAVRTVPEVEVVIIVTTDKVYSNREWIYSYREIDQLGGRDPYSSSKAAAEIAVDSFRSSFFGNPGGHHARIATVRAGNVVGGGDWAIDRLVPDCLAALAEGQPIYLRNPWAVRPWQHVLEAISGYLMLAGHLFEVAPGSPDCSAWNFGPDADCHVPVQVMADTLARLWGADAPVRHADTTVVQPHEAGLLRLDVTRARTLLGWRPRWSIERALAVTAEWHRAWITGADMSAVTRRQIEAYCNEAG